MPWLLTFWAFGPSFFSFWPFGPSFLCHWHSRGQLKSNREGTKKEKQVAAGRKGTEEETSLTDHRESGNLGLALNPKILKGGNLGGLPAVRQSGGRSKDVGPDLGTTYPKVTPITIHIEDMPPPPHPSGVLVAPSMHDVHSAPATATP